MAGMTADEIYRNFTDGAGPAGLQTMSTVMGTLAATQDERAWQIRALVARMESAWQGDAAGEARRGAGPLAVEHEMSSLALTTAQDLTSRQAGSFSEAQGRVVPVPPKPGLVNPALVFSDPAVVLDHERRVDEHNAAAQNNVDVMNGYSGASEYNTTNLPGSYGSLSTDGAGIDVGTGGVGGAGGVVIDSGRGADDTGRRSGEDSTGSSGPGVRGRDGSPDSLPVHGSPHGPGGGRVGGGPTGATRPEAFVPAASDPPAGPPPGSTAPGPGRPVVPSHGVDAVTPGAGGFGAPRGGGPPGGGFSGGPRGAGPGTGAGTDSPGPAARSGAGGGSVTGRGGAMAGGIPMASGGRARDAEDTERTRPEWLEGGDPDELFDTDVLTAPPTIGAEDD